MIFFLGFPCLVLAGSCFIFPLDPKTTNFWLLILAWLFPPWCLFVLVDAIRLVLVAKKAGSGRFDVNVIAFRSHYPRLLEFMLALWWTFLFLLSVVWGLGFGIAMAQVPWLVAAMLLFVATGLAYCSFLFLLVASAYWGLSNTRLTRLILWRPKYALLHAGIVTFAAVILAQTGEFKWQG